jgi:hypothetical protein
MSVGCWLTSCRSVDRDGYCASAPDKSEAVSEITLGMKAAKQQYAAVIRSEEYMAEGSGANLQMELRNKRDASTKRGTATSKAEI